MAEFIVLADADITNAAFWAGLDITVNSTFDASGISDNYQITITAGSISITDTTTLITTVYSDADLNSGSFSNFVEYVGNDNDSDISGSVGLNSSGYTGGDGDDTFVDDGSLGGKMVGGKGNDTITGGSGDNNIRGNGGNDILHGGGGNNNLNGGKGDDVLYGDTGSGNLIGGKGNDTIYAGPNTSFINGGSGNDSLILPAGSTYSPFSATGGIITFPGGNTATYLGIENISIICFAEGTNILTPNGNVPVNALAVGDLVNTMDSGPQAITWIGKRTVAATGAFAPIVFQPGAIGNARELSLSPQHRVLLRDWRAELLFCESEVLVGAKHLVNGDTIYVSAREQITYYHILFEQHEIVFSEGAETESFYPGKTALNGLELETRNEILALFPELATYECQDIFPAARHLLRGFEAKLLKQPIDG